MGTVLRSIQTSTLFLLPPRRRPKQQCLGLLETDTDVEVGAVSEDRGGSPEIGFRLLLVFCGF